MHDPWTAWGCLYSVAVQAQQPNNNEKQGNTKAGATGEESWPSLQPDDYLRPSPGYLVSPTYAAGYYPKLREVLYAGLSDSPTARVVVQPSFAPEYVVSIDQQAGAYYLTYRVCQTSLWSTLAHKGQSVAVTTKTVAVSQALATAIARSFNAAIAQTKYPGPVQRLGFDGTTFTFSTFRPGIGLQGGDTWSPPAGTHMGALVALADRLKQLVIMPNNQALLLDLLQDARQLTTELTK